MPGGVGGEQPVRAAPIPIDIIQDTPWDILSNQGGSEWPELLKF